MVSLTVQKWADGQLAGSTAKLECGGSPLDIRVGGHCTTYTIGPMSERLIRHLGLRLIDLVTTPIQTFTIGRISSHVPMRKLIGYMRDGNL